MAGAAFLSAAFALYPRPVLVIAPPDDGLVGVGAVPGLGSEEAAAICANQSAAQRALGAEPARHPAATLQLDLHQIPLFLCHDGRMTVFDVVLGKLAIVFLFPVRQEVGREGLLQQRRAVVLIAAGCQSPFL